MPSSIQLRWPLLAALLAVGPLNAETVATVNGEAIDSTLLDAYTEARAVQGGGGEDYLDELVVQELLVQEAQKSELGSKPEVVQQLEMQRRGVLARAALSAFVESNPVDEKDIRTQYDTMAAGMSGGKEYKARHILVASEDEATAVIEELNGGADFGELAKSKSTGPSAPNGGDLGWFQPDRMVPPFAEAVAALEPGDYSKSPVQTQFGWHVILLEESRDSEPPPFEEVEGQLQQQLLNGKVQAYLETLRAGADIDRSQE
jgi:peptidyl-prolyl cis-trans isomerase C